MLFIYIRQMADKQTYDLELLEGSRNKWKKSPGLRHVYGEIYKLVAEYMVDGPTLELGSGIGNAKEFIPGIVTSDIEKTPFVDRQESCYCISDDIKWRNFIALDVLHHLHEPFAFFADAARVLDIGGRIIITEPSANFGGQLFYKFFHHEPCLPDLIKPPFSFECAEDGEFANMGMGVGLFINNKDETLTMLGELGLKLKEIKFCHLLAYPLTGGYSKPQLAPTFCLKMLTAIEKRLPQLFMRTFALRMVIVLEKNC